MQYTFRPIKAWPGKMTTSRRRSPFGASYSRTLVDLSRELSHLVATEAVIQLALLPTDLRLDNLPRAGARPRHPGVILNFKSKTSGYTQMPCDTYLEWEDNLRAICLALTALRAVDRYGVTRSGEQYRGWSQLPPPGGIVTPAPLTSQTAARQIADIVYIAEHVAGAARRIEQESEFFRTAYRRAVKLLHPDANGQAVDPRWMILQHAAQLLEQHHGR